MLPLLEIGCDLPVPLLALRDNAALVQALLNDSQCALNFIAGIVVV
jgi:hypothetical protein